MNWQYHIATVCARLTQSTGIFYKLRHFLTPTQLQQIYHTLIYPHIYAIIAWGSAYKTHINKQQVKQNHLARVVFFEVLYGENTPSTLLLLNLLDVLTVNNVYQFKALKFIYNWHKQILNSIYINLTTLFFMLKMSSHTIRDLLPKTIYITLDLEPTWEADI